MLRGQSTRDQILDYLGSHEAASAAEMAAALGVTAANIRHHLGLLQAKGLVQRAGARPQLGRGRPVHLYRLTAEAQQPHLEPLARAMLAFFRARAQAEGRPPEAVLCDVLCAEAHPPETRLLRPRLQYAMRWLEQRRFEARWEAHSTGPRVIFYRCPYAALREDHPELCRLDVLMLERLLGVPMERVGDAGTPCEFVARVTPE